MGDLFLLGERQLVRYRHPSRADLKPNSNSIVLLTLYVVSGLSR